MSCASITPKVGWNWMSLKTESGPPIAPAPWASWFRCSQISPDRFYHHHHHHHSGSAWDPQWSIWCLRYWWSGSAPA